MDAEATSKDKTIFTAKYNFPGQFIVIDGIDGTGKTTIVKRLKEDFHTQFIVDEEHREVETVREPGGCFTAEEIRKLLIDPNIPLEEYTELTLFLAARVELINKEVIPLLKANKIVICDRYINSTLAYQLHANSRTQEDYQLKRKLIQLMSAELPEPDLKLIMTANPKTALSRAKDPNRFEGRGLHYLSLVNEGYMTTNTMGVRPNGEHYNNCHICFIKPHSTLDKVFDVVKDIVKRHLEKTQEVKTLSSVYHYM